MTYTTGATLYPNGEIRLFCRPEPGLGQKEGLSRGETHETKGETLPPPIAPTPPLDSSSDFQQPSSLQQKRRGWGNEPIPTKFGLNARRTLLRCGGAIDRMAIPKGRQVFLTGTLPGGGHAAYQAIANYSGYIMNRLKRWVAGYQEAKLDMYVWELQKRGALHLHYFVVADTDEIAARLISGFKSKWIDILGDVSVQAETNLFRSEKGTDWRDCPSKIQAYAQSVHSSAAAYLAKYCSKQSSQHSSQQSNKYFPSRWWGCSRALLAAMRERIIKFQINGLKAQSARHWYNRIVDKVEGKALAFYSYGERKGYQLFSVAYDQFHNAISIMGDVSCLRIFASDCALQLATQQAQKAVQIICLSQSKPRLWNILRRDANACCGMNPLTPGTCASIKVSRVIILLQTLESKLLLHSQEVREMTGISLTRWLGMISCLEFSLRMFIENTQSDWDFAMLPEPVLHCALTRPNSQNSEG